MVHETFPSAGSIPGELDLSGRLIDVETARSKIGLDLADYLTLCQILLEERDHIVGDLCRARDSGPQAAAKALHELANSLAVLGVTGVATTLRGLELALRDHPRPGSTEESVDFALEIFERICGETLEIIQKIRGGGGVTTTRHSPASAVQRAPA